MNEYEKSALVEECRKNKHVVMADVYSLPELYAGRILNAYYSRNRELCSLCMSNIATGFDIDSEFYVMRITHYAFGRKSICPAFITE